MAHLVPFPSVSQTRTRILDVFHCWFKLNPESAQLLGWDRGEQGPVWLGERMAIPLVGTGLTWVYLGTTSHSKAVVAVGCSLGNETCQGTRRGRRGSGFCPPEAGIPM